MGTISPGIPLSGTLQFSNPLFELLIANLGGHVVFGISLINLEGRSKGYQNNIRCQLLESRGGLHENCPRTDGRGKRGDQAFRHVAFVTCSDKVGCRAA